MRLSGNTGVSRAHLRSRKIEWCTITRFLPQQIFLSKLIAQLSVPLQTSYRHCMNATRSDFSCSFNLVPSTRLKNSTVSASVNSRSSCK